LFYFIFVWWKVKDRLGSEQKEFKGGDE
jgi:hypothetical protein